MQPPARCFCAAGAIASQIRNTTLENERSTYSLITVTLATLSLLGTVGPGRRREVSIYLHMYHRELEIFFFGHSNMIARP